MSSHNYFLRSKNNNPTPNQTKRKRNVVKTVEKRVSSDEEDIIHKKRRRRNVDIFEDENFESDENNSEDIEDEEILIGELERNNLDEGYFGSENDTFVKMMAHKLDSMFPELNLSQKKLQKIISRSIESAGNDVIEEYCGASPKDQLWKAGLERRKVKKLEPLLKKFRQEIKNDHPTLDKILESKILKDDKKRAIEQHDILNNSEPHTQEYVNIRDFIQDILKLENEIGDRDVQKLEKTEEELKKKIGNINQALRINVLDLDADEKRKIRIYEIYKRFEELSPSDGEYGTTKQKLTWYLNLPYQKMKQQETDCSKICKEINEKMYGMFKVKERVLELVNNRIQNPRSKAMIALKGKPGVGKTRVAKVIAESMNLPFEKISLGGIDDPSLINGSNECWMGSSPSLFLRALSRMGACNGVILLDEIDKIPNTDRGKSVENALLHVTDYTQNSEFQDTYLNEFTHDLSNLWFMVSMNDDKGLSSALRDRLDIIDVGSYQTEETTKIIQLHLLPSIVKDVGLLENDITITDAACLSLQSLLSRDIGETGLRPIEKELHKIVSKINMIKNEGDNPSLQLSYSLRDFNDLPYKITTETITRLWSNETVSTDYLNMYM